MGVVLRIFAFLGSALGLIAWLGGTALVAFALTSVMGSSPDHVTELAKVSVVVAGVVVALVASIVLLRVTRHLLWFFVCFACGAFAALAGAGFNPGSLSGSGSLLVVGALAILGVSVVVLAITKRMVPFLVCLGLLGLVGAGAGVFFGLNASAPMSTAEAPEALPTPTPPAPDSNESGRGMAAPTEALPPPPPEGAGQGAPPPAAAEAPPPAAGGGAAEPGDNLATGRSAAEEQASGARATPAPLPETGERRARIGATRGLRPSAAAETEAAPPPPPPPPPPEAAAPEMADQPSGSGPTAAITAPPAARSAEPTPVIAEAKPSDFQMAELKFNKPDQMEIDTPYTVSATIAGALAEAQATLGNVGPTVSRAVKITRKVRVELIADDFDIKKLSAVDTVLITPETSGQWSWQVTPRRLGGERKMLLQVYGVIESDGVAQGETLIKTYEETIPVKVTPMARVRLVSQGIVERWQPIAGALGVIGGIWVFLQKILAALTRRRKVEQA